MYLVKIENNFSYHAPKDDQPEKFVKIRDTAKEFAYLLEELVPHSEEKTEALKNLQQVVFWANAGIVRY
jgi:hypothetical protein